MKKHAALWLFLVLPLCALAGCSSAPSGGVNETQENPDATGASAAPSDWVGLSCDWNSGSMAGESKHYSMIKDETGKYFFLAETEPEHRTVKRELTQAEFDSMIQTAFELYGQAAQASPDSTAEDPVALDDNTFSFAVLTADGQTTGLNPGPSGRSLLRQFETWLAESPDTDKTEQEAGT